MAQLFTRILGGEFYIDAVNINSLDMLATPIPDSEVTRINVLPSPEQLQFKILIKGKANKSFGVEETFEEDSKTPTVRSGDISKELSDIVYLRTISVKSFETNQPSTINSF